MTHVACPYRPYPYAPGIARIGEERTRGDDTMTHVTQLFHKKVSMRVRACVRAYGAIFRDLMSLVS